MNKLYHRHTFREKKTTFEYLPLKIHLIAYREDYPNTSFTNLKLLIFVDPLKSLYEK